MSKTDEICKANELINGNTNKIYLTFEIDVPHTGDESNFNTLVLDIYHLKEMDRYEATSQLDLEAHNKILTEIQKIAELLKYREINNK